jgi:hypothetical protein
MNVSDVIHSIKGNYERFTHLGMKFSIADLMPGEGQRLHNYCQKFKPHPESNSLISLTKQFCEENGIWKKSSIHHLSCDPFLYPYAETNRLLLMMKHLALDFYLNDEMGRDIYPTLDTMAQNEATDLINRMSSADVTCELPANAAIIEKVDFQLLREIKAHSTEEWFHAFLKLYKQHVALTHKDSSASALGYIPTVNEYIENRMHTSGMIFMVMLIEFADGNFLDWAWLEKIGITAQLKRIHRVVAEFGGLSNDIFSLEKEIIDHGSESNLISVLALNDIEPNFEQSLKHAGLMVKALVCEYFNLLTRIKTKIATVSEQDTANVDALQKHLDGLEIAFKASWLWQTVTDRYKRTHSIFVETEMFLNQQLTA